MNFKTIIVALTATFSFIACSNGQNVITTQQVSDLLDKGEIQLLDVRTPEEWGEGVIEGAKLKNFYDDDFGDYLETLDKKQPIIVTCKRGGRSAEATKMMLKAGFTEVYDLGAGMDGWNAENRPTVEP